ncbi:recombinase family protein [Nonomuraea sp. NPDC059007]|uniref:recombinase family protein n=1 Tax=Nonomuraea sp. NPDC059007 TaxID=3346692 RepID=UPI003691AAB9
MAGLKLVGVIRQSRTQGDDISDKIQMSVIEDEAKRNGDEIIGWAIDLNTSASVSPWKRKELGPWLRGEKGPYDGLMAYKLDRFIRSMLDFAKATKQFQDEGRVLIAVQDRIDLSTPIGRALASILAILAELELENIKTRNRDMKRRLMSSARWAGGPPPYGYRIVRKNGESHLEVDDALVPTILMMVRLVTDGRSFDFVARLLEEQGEPTPKDHHRDRDGADWPEKKSSWHPVTVGKILTNRVLIGERESKGQIFRDEMGFPVKLYPAILTEQEWKDLQAAIHSVPRRGRKADKRHDRAELNGVGFCPRCHLAFHISGGTVHKTGRKAGKQDPYYYRCASYRLPKDQWCNNRVRADLLEATLEDALLSLYGDDPRLQQDTTSADHSQELDRVMEAIRSLRREKDEGLIFEDEEEEYFERLHRLTARRKELLAMVEASKQGPTFRKTGQTVREYWGTLDRLARNEFYREMGVKIFFDRGETFPDGSRSEGFPRPHIEWGELERLHEIIHGGKLETLNTL